MINSIREESEPTTRSNDLANPMQSMRNARLSSLDPIAQLEDDLKKAAGDPMRFPRTTKLLSAGAPQQAKKMVEEATELAIEAVRDNRSAAMQEAADLVYNLVVLLEGMDIHFADICRELERRRNAYGIAAKQPKASNGLVDAGAAK
jgi:phosphoribosyl-ATP pyrophosphohydrolase